MGFVDGKPRVAGLNEAVGVWMQSTMRRQAVLAVRDPGGG